MQRRTTRLLLVGSLAMAGLGGARVAGASQACWTNGIHVNHLGEGTLCEPAPVDVFVRTAPTIVSVAGDVDGEGGDELGTTGVGWSNTPANPRVWVDGQEVNGIPDPPPDGTTCWTNGVSVNHLGEGTLCEPTPVVHGWVKTQATAATVQGGVNDGPSVGETGVVWGGAPDVRVLVNGQDVL